MKRFDIGNSYGLGVLLFDKDGEYVLYKHSEVEKLTQLLKKSLEVLDGFDNNNNPWYDCHNLIVELQEFFKEVNG